MDMKKGGRVVKEVASRGGGAALRAGEKEEGGGEGAGAVGHADTRRRRRGRDKTVREKLERRGRGDPRGEARRG